MDSSYKLTDRQLEVLKLIAKGMTNRQIADELAISLDGAKWHVSQVLSELDCSSRDEAAQIWSEHRDRFQAPSARRARWVHAVAFAGATVAGTAIVALVVIAVRPVVGRNDGPAPAQATSTSPVTSVPGPSPTAVATASSPGAGVTPSYSRFIRPDNGRFETLLWDDRPISDEAKAAQPWYDPRWKPFSDCMVAEGFEVRADPTQPFAQADLDTIVERANQERPDGDANRLIGSDVANVPGIAGAFLRCGYWIALPRSEWAANGIVPLEPGDIPEA